MKTRILAIVPYSGMEKVINEIAARNDQMDVTIHTATRQKGLDIVQSYDLDQFDIITARSGTADLIAQHVSLPVARIQISPFDILRAIQLAKNYTNRFAIVGIASTTESAQLLCRLLDYKIHIITLNDYTEDRQAMLDLQQQGYEMVLCDMTTTFTAYELGMNYILITSGRESIEATLNQAVSTAQLYSHYRQKARLFKSALEGSAESLFMYDEERHLVFSSLARSAETESAYRTVEQNLDLFFSDETHHTEERIDGMLFSCHCHHTQVGDTAYVCIYLYKQNAPALIDDLGISIYENTDALTSDFYGSANLIGETRRLLESYAKTLRPVLILGECGTGKDNAASFLYQQSTYKKHPYFIIDCETTNQKKWNYFMENPNSPLNDLHITIYIKNLQALEEPVAGRFLSYLKQNDLCRANRFLFSYVWASEEEISSPTCQYLLNNLACMPLRLPPLRDRAADIPSIATLYISQANIEYGKQIVGFEPEAMALIQDFGWPQNLAQFKRVIRQLIILTNDDYISTDLVRLTLKQETPKVTASLHPGYEIVNTNQSLDEIDRDIVRMVLEQENMSRSKAVERLKISRTTLWRMLQN